MAATSEFRFVFTEARLRALPSAPVGKRSTYYDTERGSALTLRVTDKGAKTFVVRRRARGGEAERVTIGAWPKWSVTAARKKAAELVGQIAAAESPAEARRLRREQMTFGELVEQYLADRRSAGRRSVDDIEAMLRRHVIALPAVPRLKHGKERERAPEAVDWTRRRFGDIDHEMVKRLHRAVCARSPVTANRLVEHIRAVYSFAIKARLTTDNPAVGVTMAPRRERARFLQADELAAFEAAVMAEHQPWQDYFLVLLLVGYRRSAVAAMRWADVDLERAVWTVPGERAKNGTPVVLPLAGRALDILRARHERREHRAWVFPGEAREGHIGRPKAAWARVLKRAGLQNLRPHDLRRTLGSWMAHAGLPVLAIGRALGHKDSRSTEVYARMQADAVRDAVAQAHDAMARARAGKPSPTPDDPPPAPETGAPAPTAARRLRLVR